MEEKMEEKKVIIKDHRVLFVNKFGLLIKIFKGLRCAQKGKLFKIVELNDGEPMHSDEVQQKLSFILFDLAVDLDIVTEDTGDLLSSLIYG